MSGAAKITPAEGYERGRGRCWRRSRNRNLRPKALAIDPAHHMRAGLELVERHGAVKPAVEVAPLTSARRGQPRDGGEGRQRGADG